jgi:hypothetical protein
VTTKSKKYEISNKFDNLDEWFSQRCSDGELFCALARNLLASNRAAA